MSRPCQWSCIRCRRDHYYASTLDLRVFVLAEPKTTENEQKKSQYKASRFGLGDCDNALQFYINYYVFPLSARVLSFFGFLFFFLVQLANASNPDQGTTGNPLTFVSGSTTTGNCYVGRTPNNSGFCSFLIV
jgi:hypothetical protein